jgi:hypothetical protein
MNYIAKYFHVLVFMPRNMSHGLNMIVIDSLKVTEVAILRMEPPGKTKSAETTDPIFFGITSGCGGS